MRFASSWASGLGLSMLMSGAACAADGVLWESTSQMQMPGMPMQMPAQKRQICAPKQWTQPPPAERNCTQSNFKMLGSKATWTVQCTGEMAMSGTGEIEFTGSDSYTGALKLAASGMEMKVNLSGKKLGACDKPQ
jgi:hypothetical protein